MVVIMFLKVISGAYLIMLSKNLYSVRFQIGFQNECNDSLLPSIAALIECYIDEEMQKFFNLNDALSHVGFIKAFQNGLRNVFS